MLTWKESTEALAAQDHSENQLWFDFVAQDKFRYARSAKTSHGEGSRSSIPAESEKH